VAITGEEIKQGGSSNGKTEKKTKEEDAEKEEDRVQSHPTWQRSRQAVWLL